MLFDTTFTGGVEFQNHQSNLFSNNPLIVQSFTFHFLFLSNHFHEEHPRSLGQPCTVTEATVSFLSSLSETIQYQIGGTRHW